MGRSGWRAWELDVTTDSLEIRNLRPTMSGVPGPSVQRCNILGVNVSAVNMALATKKIESWIANRECNYVCITGVHGVMESQRQLELKHIHNRAGMVTPDGMPMVWVNRLRGNSHVSRVYGPDLMLEMCRRSVEKGYRHFLYGGGEGVAELLKRKLQEKCPGVQIVGTYTPPFRKLTDEEDADVCRIINASQADIVWVGLSTPKQEYWMSQHLGTVSYTHLTLPTKA
jgi:N-acetylglucosaminyldiphosphoundecaprenol N-acetyl-beta-D-mannosaminyltransferase